MALVVSRIKVKDFATWKAAFDQFGAQRAAAGLASARINRSADDGNEVWIAFDNADIAKAKAFFGSPELHSQAAASGVIGKPEVYYLNPV